MLTAIRTVHGKNGPWASKGGYEYNVVLIAAALALVEVGPEPASLDAARGRERSGAPGRSRALLAGGVGAPAPPRGSGGRQQPTAQSAERCVVRAPPETNSQAAPKDARDRRAAGPETL